MIWWALAVTTTVRSLTEVNDGEATTLPGTIELSLPRTCIATVCGSADDPSSVIASRTSAAASSTASLAAKRKAKCTVIINAVKNTAKTRTNSSEDAPRSVKAVLAWTLR